jgi:hypothetical protein
MITSSLHNQSNSYRQIQPKTVWLEPEHYERAIEISQKIDSDINQWKAYLNELAFLGFTEWLQQQIPDIEVKQNLDLHQERVNLQVGEFKVQLITVDNLDDNVTIPLINITSPQLAAHFYVLIEVLEEAERITIHGIIRHDELSQIQKLKYLTTQSEVCEIPLSSFDGEVDNLLLYIRFLQVEAIPLPSIKNKEISKVTKALVNLGPWWSRVFEENWQSLEEIFIPQTSGWGFARSNKLSEFPIQRGKLFDFGLLLNGQRFVLVVNMRLEENQDKGVLVQIRYQNQDCLPPGLKLKVTLNYNTPESESETAIARESDQIIQLEFSEASSTHFKVEAIYQDAEFTEEFILL